MADEGRILEEVGLAASRLSTLGRPFALVGGLAVSIRGEVRFTRDVDLAIDVPSDDETLVRDLCAAGYSVVALVEHDDRKRRSTVRLRSRAGVNVDLLAARSGIEREVVSASDSVEIEGAGSIPVACAEDLLATKLLAMSERRPQDRLDARGLILANPTLDLTRVRTQLARITERGFDRGKDLEANLQAVLAEVAST